MSQEPQEIEVEVVELKHSTSSQKPRDPQHAKRDPGEGILGDRLWNWQGQARKINPRWWPVWLIPGLLLCGIAAVMAVALGVLAVLWLLLRGFIRLLIR
ncbi:MAG: hypothetical protein ACO3RV_08445 [Luteolibacter sp.]